MKLTLKQISVAILALVLFGFASGWFALETVQKFFGRKRTIAIYVENPRIPFDSHIEGIMRSAKKELKPGDQVYGWFAYGVTERDLSLIHI